MISRNIFLSYLLSFLRTTWFWLGIWVFYYLRFTNYAGIGLIETVLIVTMTIFEIPTGAIADLLGRKRTLFVSFFLQAICQFWMAYTGNLTGLCLAVFIGGLGGTLYSGTMDALVFDSLKQNKLESKYSRVLAHSQTIQLISMTICGVIGGFLYRFDPRLPFVLSGVCYLLATGITVFLVEPSVDTDQFSFSNYLFQMKQGFSQLFNQSIRSFIVLLLVIGGIFVISSEMLDSILGYEFGFTDIQLGVFTSVVFLISALISQFASKVKNIIVIILPAAIVYLLSPVSGVCLGGLLLVIRQISDTFFQNYSSDFINQHIESKYRATTISTFNMVKNIPYVFTAVFLGAFMDSLGATTFAFTLGLVLMVVIIVSVSRNKLNLRS